MENIRTAVISSIDEKKKKGKKALLKLLAVAVSMGLLTVGAAAALDHIPDRSSGPSVTLDPDPVVLEIEAAEQETDESEYEKEKKRGFFGYLKIWLYGIFAGIGGFFAVKVPWKKIFSRRNLWILLILAAALLFGRYVLPHFAEVPWGADSVLDTNN